MKDRVVKVISNNAIADGVFKMVLQSDDFEPTIGGQFIHIQLPNKAHILRRPFCIADYNTVDKTIEIAYALVGDGTVELSQVAVGEQLKALFPLGNGFKMKGLKKVIILSGGLGTAVLPAIPTTMPQTKFYAFVGFGTSSKAILLDELRGKCVEVNVATDDGSMGYKGFVTDLMKSRLDDINPDAILCCGPEIMYKSLRKVMEGVNIPVYISLEQRMGCGVGACLVCNCKIATSDGMKYKRVCVDGPVFKLDEVIL